MGEDQEYRLLTTSRYDRGLEELRWNDDCEGPCPFLLLQRHHYRLTSAAQEHGWAEVQDILKDYSDFKSICLKAVADHKPSNSNNSDALRLRITVDRCGILTVACAPIPPFTHDPSLLVYQSPTNTIGGSIIEVRVDKTATSPSLFTKTKTTMRAPYDKARTRNNLPPLTTPQGMGSDVLLVDRSDHILECTIFNVAFYRSSRWVTPHAKYGCLPGVFRGWLLERSLILEDSTDMLMKDAVTEGELLLLFNGSQGCRLGRIVLG